MESVLRLKNVSVIRSGQPILNDFNLHVKPGEQWVVVGPNGAGQTTVVSLLSTLIHPTSGEVEILGEQLGLTDVFELRPRIGVSSAALASGFTENQTVNEIVLTAAYGMTAGWRETYEDLDQERANSLLEKWQIADLSQRAFGTLSEGERKRVQIARALMPNPELLVLDEPAAGLDIAAREQLTRSLSDYIAADDSPNTILVTHHVEEIPPAATHAVLLRAGKTIAAGPINDVITSPNMSATFGVALTVGIIDTLLGRRWSARLS